MMMHTAELVYFDVGAQAFLFRESILSVRRQRKYSSCIRMHASMALPFHDLRAKNIKQVSMFYRSWIIHPNLYKDRLHMTRPVFYEVTCAWTTVNPILSTSGSSSSNPQSGLWSCSSSWALRHAEPAMGHFTPCPKHSPYTAYRLQVHVSYPHASYILRAGQPKDGVTLFS